jgi:two-component system response regulator NreC
LYIPRKLRSGGGKSVFSLPVILPRPQKPGGRTVNAVKHKVVIAEDHTILREGLRALLLPEEQFEVIGEANNGREAVQIISMLQPDVVLMDLSMPKLNGMEAIREVKVQYPQIKIIALTVHKAEEYILAALQAGANGYILKDATRHELITALHYVMAGKSYISPEISGTVIGGYLSGHQQIKNDSPWECLSKREREILKLIAEGHKNREIADQLCLSLKTVEKHRSNLMKKLDLHNTAALTAYAVGKGIV